MASEFAVNGDTNREACEKLDALVRHFEQDTFAHGRLIRKIARNDENFLVNAIHVLSQHEDSRGSQCLLTALAENGLLLEALAAPRFSYEQALRLAQAALRAGQMVDVAIARYLSEHAAAIGEGACPPDVQRLTEILSEVSQGARVLPSLMPLLRHPNPHLQSKAVLTFGRIKKNARWVLSRLAGADSRVRANAIEALWGTDSPEVRLLLRAAARDRDNRVAGNALIALHRLGDSYSVPELLALVNHESPRFRATAAWVMGESADPIFTKSLARLVSDSNTVVRARAFASLTKIKATAARTPAAERWMVAARFRDSRVLGQREIDVDVSTVEGGTPVRVLPRQFILTQDGQHVTSYEVEDRPAVPPVAVAFVHPVMEASEESAFTEGTLCALQWKRAGDVWAVSPFTPSEPREIKFTFLAQDITLPADGEPSHHVALEFLDEPKAIKAAILAPPTEGTCDGLWDTVRRVAQRFNDVQGQRHLILYTQQDSSRPRDYTTLLAVSQMCQICVHGITLVANQTLENLCRHTHGNYQCVESPDDVQSWIERTCLELTAQYKIRYQPTEGKENRIVIRAQSPTGWGETSLLIPAILED